jgi:hypothetical protein
MSAMQDVLLSTNYCRTYRPHYRDMAVDALRLARRATSTTEQDRYLLAAVYCVKRTLQVEKMLQRSTESKLASIIARA